MKRIAIFFMTAFVSSCTSFIDRDQEPDVFGFIESCKRTDWETCRRSHISTTSLDENSPYHKMVRRSYELIRPYAVKKLGIGNFNIEFDIQILTDSTNAFMFETYATGHSEHRVHVLRTSAETLSTLFKIASAAELTNLPKIDEEWLASYLLLLRKTPENRVIPDPFRVSGLVFEGGEIAVDAPDFTEAIKEGINRTQYIVDFLVAHELYHAAYPLAPKGTGESTQEYFSRRRQHESEADYFAFSIMSDVEVAENSTGTYLYVPGYIFSQFIVVMQGERARHRVSPKTHPPDHRRFRDMTMALQEWINEHSSDPRASDLHQFVLSSLKIYNRIETEIPSVYFAGLDEEAKSVELSKLHVY